MNSDRYITHVKNFDWELLESPESNASLRNVIEEIPRRIQPDPEEKRSRREGFSYPETGEPEYYVKIHHFQKPGKRIKNTVLKDHARKEFDLLYRCYLHSLPVPRPVGMATRSISGLRNISLQVTRFVPDLEEGTPFLRTLLQENRTEWIRIRSILWEEVAQLFASLIREGIFHRDLHINNLLFQRSDNGAPRVLITDFHQAAVCSTLSRWQVERMVEYLFSSLAYEVSAPEQLRLWKQIQEKTGPDNRLPTSRELPGLKRRRRREKYKSRTRDILKGRKWVRPTTLFQGTYTGFRNESISEEDLECILSPFVRDDQTPDPVTHFHTRPTTSLYRMNHGDHSWMVKEYRDDRLSVRLRRLVGKSRAKKSWLNHLKLRLRNVHTPVPVALLEPVSPMKKQPSYLILPYINAPDLKEYTYILERTNHLDRTTRNQFMKKLGTYIRNLHRKGILHKDLKTSNIKVLEDDENGDLTFSLLDTDRVTFYDRPLTPDERIRNFMQLCSTMPPPITLIDRYRLWRVLRNAPVFAEVEERKYLGRLLRAVRERKKSWPPPGLFGRPDRET